MDDHVADLCLARACALGDPAALEEFERRHMPDVEAALARFRLPADEVDELKQIVRERLLVGSDGMPRITRYRGNGPLGAWVRVVAARAAIDSRRQRARRAAREQATMAELVTDDGRDPGRGYERAVHGAAIKQVIEESLAALDDDARTLLRLYHVDQLGIVAIGKLIGVAPVTVFRRLGRARERFAEHARQLLVQRLNVTATELDSLLHDVRSQLHVTLGRIL